MQLACKQLPGCAAAGDAQRRSRQRKPDAAGEQHPKQLGAPGAEDHPDSRSPLDRLAATSDITPWTPTIPSVMASNATATATHAFLRPSKSSRTLWSANELTVRIGSPWSIAATRCLTALTVDKRSPSASTSNSPNSCGFCEVRHVHVHLGRLRQQAADLYVLGHAYDLAIDWPSSPHPYLAAERALAGREAACHRLADDRNGRASARSLSTMPRPVRIRVPITSK